MLLDPFQITNKHLRYRFNLDRCLGLNALNVRKCDFREARRIWDCFLALFQHACTFVDFFQIFVCELLLEGSQSVFLFLGLALRVFTVYTFNCQSCYRNQFMNLPGVIKIANLCGFSSKYCLIFFSKIFEFKSPLSLSIISLRDRADTGFPPWIQMWVRADTKLNPKLVET